MNEQTIPAEKVRELIEAHEDGETNYLLDDLRALLPVQQPTTGLLGRWAKHPDYGDVMCVWDKPKDGWINIYKRANNGVTGAEWYQIQFSELTFPHQATKPEDVPAGEAWLVDVKNVNFSAKNVVAFKHVEDSWHTALSVTGFRYWNDSEVTLVAPLTPERPVSDLQAKYDELDAKYREAQEKIKALEQPLPAWRIEHDPDNLRVGEYIIDRDGDTGTITYRFGLIEWATDGAARTMDDHAPFIVFPNEDAATPEAIEEAKQARDKETGE